MMKGLQLVGYLLLSQLVVQSQCVRDRYARNNHNEDRNNNRKRLQDRYFKNQQLQTLSQHQRQRGTGNYSVGAGGISSSKLSVGQQNSEDNHTEFVKGKSKSLLF